VGEDPAGVQGECNASPHVSLAAVMKQAPRAGRGGAVGELTSGALCPLQVALALFQVLLMIWLRTILVAVYKALVGLDLTEIEAQSDQAWQTSEEGSEQRAAKKKA
jgi:hypothetical protein